MQNPSTNNQVEAMTARMMAMKKAKEAMGAMQGMSTEAKIGLAVVGIAVLVGIGFAVWYFAIRKKEEEEAEGTAGNGNGNGDSSGTSAFPGRAIVKSNWRDVNSAGGDDATGGHAASRILISEIAPIPKDPLPYVLTALSGTGTNHHNYVGKQALYFNETDGFNVYLHNVTRATALAESLRLNVMAFGSADTGDKWVVGRSENNIWEPYETSNMVGTIPFPSGKFTNPPRVVTSISCGSHCWTIPGASSIYNVTKDNFKIYVPGWTPAFAADKNLRVTFLAFEDGVQAPGVLMGSSPAWEVEGSYVVCKIRFPPSSTFTEPPVVVTSLQGISHIWERPDGGSIFNLTKYGFDVRLHGGFDVAATITHQVRVNFAVRKAN
jgi:hypothetical protein